MDRGLPGSSAHGIFLARILKQVSMPSSRISSRPKDQTCVSCISCTAGEFFTAESLGKPQGDQKFGVRKGDLVQR